ncbi:DUF2807 domain-containing protein [Pedobacter sp. MC2016-14]|uniref:head GIN domain-containing protein n=1 Tax=Pedobacter sp. MC2016-14 TaxID=2897327 RepID=UPI001E5D7D92|nr:head GIN domain-containing protein [Pedobacter sp. MC2016-14]MCD0489027.1 DUF2807 domain-containing protein [Pedobacter sp. MC2016-14]
MKKLSILMLFVPVVFAACKSKCLEDSGIHINKDVSLKVFDEIKVSGPLKLVIKQDSSYTLQLSADSNIIDQIKTEVSGGELKISLDPGKYCGQDSIVVHAGIGELKELEVENRSQVFSSGIVHVGELKVKLSDTTALTLNLDAAQLKTEVNGKSKISLSGQTGKHEFKSKGAIELNAFNFVSGLYDLNIEGVGKSNINVLNELKVKTNGASEIYYKGSPKKIEEKKNGIGKLEKAN